MKSINFLLAFVVFIFIANCATGQTLTDEEKQIFRDRVEAKVLEFQDGLQSVVNDQLSRSVRTEYTKNVLGLFIGKGEPYSLLEYGRKISHSAVKMQTSSINHSRITTQKVKEYLYKLFDPATGRSKMRYSKIRMEFSDAVRVDNIEKVGDHYECTAYYCQKFIGYGPDGQIKYGEDLTWKKIRCYITYTKVPNGPDNNKLGFWDAKLGDIFVVSTEKL